MQTTKNSQKLQESLKCPKELMGKFGNFLGPEVNKRRIQRSDQTEKPVLLPDTGGSHGPHSCVDQPPCPPWNKERKVLTGDIPDVGSPNVRTTRKAHKKISNRMKGQKKLNII